MENQIITAMPEEVAQIAKGVSEEKRNEVQAVLNKVFNGVSKMREQLEHIVVEDENDKVNMKLANTIRLAIRDQRLDAEKVFDAKRSEVQLQMLSYKTEDSLWLKAKQTMQILTKENEEIARYKEETRQRFLNEQRGLKIQERIIKVSKIAPEISRSEFESMTDETFDMFYSGIEKAYNDKIEAEKKAELERIENDRLDKLGQDRKIEIAPFAQFIGKSQDLRTMTDSDYLSLLSDLQKAKSDYEIEQEKIRVQNEELKAEKERTEKLRSERLKELQPYIKFIRNYDFIEKSEEEYKSELAEIKKGAEDHWAFEREEQIRLKKEREDSEEKLRLEKEKAAKIQKELDDKKAAELKIEQERNDAERLAKLKSEKLAKAPVKDKMNLWIDSLNIDDSILDSIEKDSSADIVAINVIAKFKSFKEWAKKEIENL